MTTLGTEHGTSRLRRVPLRMTARRRTGRLRAVLALGTVLGLGSVNTLAAWTDNVPITGTTFTSGTLDIQVNAVNSYATTTLSMSGMVPGATSAEVLTVRNAGSAALTFTMTGGLSGTDAAAYATASALRLTVRDGGTRSGTGNSATCGGGTVLVNAVPLTATPATGLITAAQGPLAAAGTKPLCFQISFDAAAPSSLQGRTTTATFTVTGTST